MCCNDSQMKTIARAGIALIVMAARRRNSGRWWTAALLGGTLVGCGQSPTTDAPSVAIINNLVLLDTSVNRSPAIPFLLDTGASVSVIDTTLAARLGIVAGEASDAATGGGSVAAAKIAGVDLHVGNRAISAHDAVAIDLSGLAAGLGTPVGGILGFQVFHDYVVEIDYRNGRVQFHEPRTYTAPAGSQSVPITIEDHIPYMLVGVFSNGHSADAKVEVDTGLTGAVTLLRAFVDANDLLRPTQRQVPIIAGALLPGKVPASITRVDKVRVGQLDIMDVLTNVAPDVEAAGVEAGIAGLIGGELLRRFDIAIDYSRERILFSTSDTRLGTPTEFDMSGISLVAQGSSYREYRVRAVVPDSPASDVGILAGDLLTAIDGRPAASVTLAELRQLLRTPDRSCELEFQRKGAPRHVTLRTRRLV
jgi:predicted aspartyl protease